MDCRPIIEKLRKEQDAQMEELRYLLEHLDEESSAYLRAAAAEEAVRHFGRKIYRRDRYGSSAGSDSDRIYGKSTWKSITCRICTAGRRACDPDRSDGNRRDGDRQDRR